MIFLLKIELEKKERELILKLSKEIESDKRLRELELRD